MLQSMGSQRIGHDLATEQLQKGDGEEIPENEAPSNLDCPVTLWMDQELGYSGLPTPIANICIQRMVFTLD